MKKLVKPVQVEAMAVLAYDNENCSGANCASGCGGGGSSSNAGAWIAAGATVVAACIAAICT